jgi:hypothetical protein
MQKVHIHTQGTGKFVLLQDLENNEIHIVSSPILEYHADILDDFSYKTRKQYTCLGGGRMTVTEDSIRCFGYSIGYGRPDSDTVEEILKQNTNKKIIMEIGVGY